MKLCVVMPALNEAATIRNVIERIPRQMEGVSHVIIAVVDDGSSDDTAAIARDAGSIVVSHMNNLGVGAAFRTGVDKALELGADVMVNMDADGQFDPEDIPRLLAPILAGQADFVTASRFKDKTLHPEMTRVKFHGNRIMAVLVSALTGHRFYDVSCGFRAYTRDSLLRLNLFGDFTYTQETFLDLTFKGARIVETPVRVRGVREFGKSRVASNLFRYTFRTSKIIFRCYRDYKPLRIFSLMAATIGGAGMVMLALLVIRWWYTGMFTPYKSVGFVGGFLVAMGVLVFTTGLMADMLARIRINQERILYFLRKRGLE